MELVDVAYNSAGRSSEQFAKYQDTVEYKLKQLSNTWEQFRTSFLSSDTYKGFIDFANKLLSTINDMDLTQLLTVGTIGLTLGRSVVLQFVDGLRSSVNLITTTWNDVLKQSINKINIDKVFAGFGNKIRNISLPTAANALINVGVASDLAQNNANALLTYVQMNQEINKIKSQYLELKNRGNELNQKDRERLAYLEEQLSYLRSQRKETRKLLAEGGISGRTLGQAAGNEQLNRSARFQNWMYNTGLTLKNNFSMAASNAISAAITSSLITGISGADFSTILKTAGVSAIVAAAPSIVQAFVSIIAGSATLLTGAIVAAVGVAAFAFAVHWQKEQKEAERAELNRLAGIKKANEDLQKQNENAVAAYQKSLSEQEKREKAINDLQELQAKKFLTKQEQETLDSAVSFLQDNYEGLLNEDELTGHFNIIETKLDEIAKNTEKEQREEISQIRNNIETQQRNLADRVDQRNYLLDEMRASGLVGTRTGPGRESKYSEFWGTPEQYKDIRYNDIFYARPDIAFKEVQEELQELKTIYGDALDLNNVFGMDLESLLYADLSNEELTARLEQGNVTAQVIEEKIETIQSILEGIDRDAEKDLSRKGTQDILLLQGWDETAAAVASYSQEKLKLGKSKTQSTFDKGRTDFSKSNQDFLEQIKSGDFNALFGVNSKTAEESLALLGYGEGQDKALKDLFSSGTNFAKWNDLSEQLRAALEAIGMNQKTWDSDGEFKIADRKQSDIMAKTLIEVMSNALIKESEILSEETQKALEANKSEYEEFAKVLSNTDNKTWFEYSKKVNGIINSAGADTKTAMEEYSKAVESNYSLWQGYVDALTGTSSNLNIDSGIAGKLDFSSAKYLNDQLSTLELSDFGYARLSDYINSSFDNLSGDALNILANIPIDDIASLTVESSKEYIDRLTKATGSAAKATELFYDYINNVQVISRRGAFLGKDSTTIYKEQIQEQFKNFSEDYKSLFEANDEMLENQALSSATYFKLLEDGFGDYVDVTADGYTLLKDKAEEAWVSMAMAPRNQIKNSIKQQNALIDEATNMFDSQAKVEANRLIKLYKERFESGQEITDVFFKNMSESQADFIKFVAESGYDSIGAYIAALQEGKAALAEMDSDAYIQGLVSLKEATEQAKEEAEDLKEKIADLDEELKELNEDLAEAEDELRQAMHGSDDFQSSLDGLINYAQKLEELNRTIERTKESLEEVSNVDEAKGLLSQLNEQYNNKTITLGAENIAIDKALGNLQSTLLGNYSDYISFDENGNAMINFAYQAMDANDEIRKAFEEEYNLYNEYKQKKEENLDEIAAIEKEKQERRKEALNNFVQVQEDVIAILKEQAQEEIDVTKDKYDALEEADNEYLDALEEAIAKQRELREQQDKYDDLATKEKKLSLLQRDTSGANQKEVLSLENEIQDDREELLDNEVDNLIESMRELYEKQKEARDSEIEYMEEVTENAQYFADWAANIVSSWQSVEDMQSWYLQNDPNAKDMTVEQTEVYLNEIGKKYSDYVEYIATLATDFTTDQEALNEAMNVLYENTGNNIETIGTTTQVLAENTASDLILEATEARDKILDKINDTKKELEDAEEKLKTTEQNALDLHSATMAAMVEASQSAMKDVSLFATRLLVENSGVDFNNPEQVEKWAKNNNLALETSDGIKYSQSIIDVMNENGFDTSWMQALTRVNESYNIYSKDDPTSTVLGTANSESAAQKKAKELGIVNPYISLNPMATQSVYGSVHGTSGDNFTAHSYSPDSYEVFFPPIGNSQPTTIKYKTEEEANRAYADWNNKYPNSRAIKRYITGGLIDYTGPAWVDGTKSKPESFLNAQDTQRIGAAARILADIPILNSTSNAQNAVSTNIGDTSIEIHINVDNVSSDYDVDRMIDRVKQDIIDVSKPTGTPVILRK